MRRPLAVDHRLPQPVLGFIERESPPSRSVQTALLPAWAVRHPVSDATSCASSSQPSTSYYTPRPTESTRLAAAYNSPLSPSVATHRIMATTPRSRVAPQPLFQLPQSPQFVSALRGDASPRQALSPGRSSSPTLRHQALIYRPPPLSARRAVDPVSSSRLPTDSSFSPPLRFFPYDRNGCPRFDSFGGAHDAPNWMGSDFHGTDRKKKRTRPVPTDFASTLNSSSSRRTPAADSKAAEPPSSSATTSESTFSPRHVLYECQTPRATDSSSKQFSTGRRGVTLEPVWQHARSEARGGPPGTTAPPPRLNKGIPRLPLRQLDWQREQPQRSQPVAASLSRSDATFQQAIPITARDLHQASLNDLNRFGAGSRPALSSRVHLQTAGGRQEALLRPIPHKRVVAAAGVKQFDSRCESASMSLSTATASVALKQESSTRHAKRKNDVSKVAPLSARPTLVTGSSSRKNVASSRTTAFANGSGCLTARPATQDHRRYVCADFCANDQASLMQKSTRTNHQKPQRATASSTGGLVQPSISLSQTSTANDSQSSHKAEADDSKYKKRSSLTSKERPRTSLFGRQPLRSSLKEVQSLASFETIAMIGQGGYAVVRVVRHKASNQIFALKQVAKVDFTSVAQLRMAFTEVDILYTQEKLSKRHSGAPANRRQPLSTDPTDSQRRMHISEYVKENGHTFFPRFFSCWQDESFIFFLMEYLPGGDLMKHLIDREIFSETVAKFYTAQIAVATGFMHDHLLYVHRDIKPDNVLFDTSGHTKLVDFGLSRVLPPRLGDAAKPKFTEAFQSAVGTPDYMAPEVHRPGVAHDRTIDWWSLGIILYEMLFGGPPLSDLHHRPEVTSQLIRNWKSFLTSWPKTPPVSNLAKDLLGKLIAEKEDRYKNVEDVLSHPWFADLNLDELRTMRAPIIPKTFGPTDVRNFDSFTPSKLIQWEEKKTKGAVASDVAAVLLDARRGLHGELASREGFQIPFVSSRPSTATEHYATGARPLTTDPITAKHLFQSSHSSLSRCSRNSLSCQPTPAPKTAPNKSISPALVASRLIAPPLSEATRKPLDSSAKNLPPTRSSVTPDPAPSEDSRQVCDPVSRCRTEIQQRRMPPSSAVESSALLQHINKAVHPHSVPPMLHTTDALVALRPAPLRSEVHTLLLGGDGASISSSIPSAYLSAHQQSSSRPSKVASQTASTEPCAPSDLVTTSSRQPPPSSTLLSEIKTKVTRWLTSSSSSSSASSATAQLKRDGITTQQRRVDMPFYSLKQAAGVQCESRGDLLNARDATETSKLRTGCAK
eukprot:Gregarina_sp_Poly_1__9916@NODE_64_length_16522_cov_117_152963_g55_i0_p1_GENE_NODE_64_length_16522_cov_117_152963_g55_i0NODE_64_length_16522_cov_117_152963_g55_i0_p1_ORF_typecomplete_len1291_score182_23Pkinase/PF00069_25/7_2e54Pkinase_Tyr/PF07714_17/4_9e27Kinaselike/PF14531_6/3_9e10Kdo/PF06293_14/8_1e08Pkinase_fungal/PF17667_1/5_6e06APH/PF01636_23/5_4e05APH/PF01636_23/6_6e02EcKinase/PF02958_20/0_011WaaY/PF06176_11/0_064_NODE_64_length_16522_cov_117_152963_g55_i0702310895